MTQPLSLSGQKNAMVVVCLDRQRLPAISERNSLLVTVLLRKVPRTADVIIFVPGFLTPRIIMQRCSA